MALGKKFLGPLPFEGYIPLRICISRILKRVFCVVMPPTGYIVGFVLVCFQFWGLPFFFFLF